MREKSAAVKCMVLAVGTLFTSAFATETSAPLAKQKDVVIYSDPTFYSTFPSVVLRPDGELLCAFRRAPSRRFLYGAAHDTHTDPNSQLMLVRSRDNGESWTSAPELIFAHPLGGSQDPCMVQLNDGTIVCTSYGWSLLPSKQTTGTREHQYTFLGGYVLRSRDDGKSWQGPFIPSDITDHIAGAKPRPTYNRGAPIQADTGEILWATVKQGPLNSRIPTSVCLLSSKDAGETWNVRSTIAADPNITFNETSLVQTRAGDIVAFLRTERPDEHAAIARSTDGGKSFHWDDLGFHAVPMQALRLRDDRILLVYGYRQKPYGVRARVLNADASDARTSPEFVIRDDAGTWDVGYPWAVQLKDGRVLVVYYINNADGPRYIAASVLSLK